MIAFALIVQAAQTVAHAVIALLIAALPALVIAPRVAAALVIKVCQLR